VTRTLAVIAARGGSKGIPHKNLVPLCGKPLLAWSVEQAKAARHIDEVAVSSDSDEILAAAERHGAIGVKRPADISGDTASSESAWLHALDARETAAGPFGLVLSMQATSPIREASDLDRALELYDSEGWDSLFSACEVEDFFNWRKLPDGGADSVNYDWRSRRRRQEIEKRYLENGSFYITPASMMRQTRNRLGGRIGMFVMDRHKMFQIDRPEDIKLCEAIMRGYGYA
jgi:N-acylneuraminate cytidylyltransferase